MGPAFTAGGNHLSDAALDLMKAGRPALPPPRPAGQRPPCDSRAPPHALVRCVSAQAMLCLSPDRRITAKQALDHQHQQLVESAVRPVLRTVAPSASLGHLKAQEAAPTQPRAQPEHLGSSPWAQEPASGRPRVADFPLATDRYFKEHPAPKAHHLMPTMPSTHEGKGKPKVKSVNREEEEQRLSFHQR